MSQARIAALFLAFPLLCGLALGIQVRTFAGGVCAGVCGLGLLGIAAANAMKDKA